MEKEKLDVIRQIIWLRLAQVIINNGIKNGEFLIPIHLAIGHESLAVAVDKSMDEEDSLFLTHRNMHYNLIREKDLKPVLDEYYLKNSGLAAGQLGSMNLNNPNKGVIYASSILGNNFSVGSGYALGNKVLNCNGVVFIITGDGGIEEGAFYESLIFLKSNKLPSVIIIENNEWSLATRIRERRTEIDLNALAQSMGLEYTFLSGNDPFEYIKQIQDIRSKSVFYKTPILIEVKLNTLGYWYLTNEENPTGKFINYHAGPAPEIEQKDYPLIESSQDDPLYVLENYLSLSELTIIAKKLSKQIQEQIS